MPSPFPGMDPYLEEPGLWPDVHHNLISELQAMLNRLIRPKYVVRIEQRTYISDDSDPGRELVIPDLRLQTDRTSADRAPAPSASTTATADEPVIATTLLDEEIREYFLKVIDPADQTVITVIEVLSPANKRSGARGRRLYRRKRREVMASECHLVEIDLLRRGRRIPIRERLPEYDYLIHVSRTESRPKGRLWPIRLPNRLPTVPIPLREPDENALVEFQKILVMAYERGAYDADIHYASEPTPPLTPEQARWADELLKSKGLR